MNSARPFPFGCCASNRPFMSPIAVQQYSYLHLAVSSTRILTQAAVILGTLFTAPITFSLTSCLQFFLPPPPPPPPPRRPLLLLNFLSIRPRRGATATNPSSHEVGRQGQHTSQTSLPSALATDLSVSAA
ncbi:hypothetical protein LX32DRAFT_25581 [Colletotrichum zoysiae]|uniref:Uncharacterized protein n=1 Tax=Colletotrichum zoysiae TaxID=1216348 RepID=A0AAD9HS03_9PEZI|nr:hypothetical protein LX32DRAFT_25581 [Colletotrichum zoysiae]